MYLVKIDDRLYTYSQRETFVVDLRLRHGIKHKDSFPSIHQPYNPVVPLL